ncbi:MAG: glycosyltransferase family 39 protein [Candidatus Daviesbacteria bacterium]|nr:glycosyltransferase family 39 protein [Candidatus Daviesbacteria bacterium]
MNIFKNKILYIVILTMIVGGLLRFSDITKNPVSLNIDEVAYGYNAYSILKTGKDEYGVRFPLVFKSVGDYKPPVGVYLAVPSIAIFGLNEFGIRFPAAFLATLAIGLYFIVFKTLVKNEKFALAGAILLAVSPWDIYYSRYATTEIISSTIFAIFGLYSYFRMKTGSLWWSFIAGISFGLSMYAYHAERLFIPVFLLFLSLQNYKEYFSLNKKNILFTGTLIIFILPLVTSTLFGPDKSRFQATFITNDVNFIRQVAVETVSDLPSSLQTAKNFANENLLIFFYWARKYLAYFQPSFLFYNGLNMTHADSLNLGVLYLFELPFLLFGVLTLVKQKIPNKRIILGWLLLGILPASLTVNEQHAGRTYLVMPFLQLVCGIGMISSYQFLKQNASKYKVILTIFAVVVVWNLLYALITFTAIFPNEKGEDFMEGTKQTVEYALAHKSEYQEIVFDPTRGVEGPYIVSIPHMYILFYSQFDPQTYQSIPKRYGKDLYGFDKFTIRKIDWTADKDKKGTLFVGSPWSIPEKELKNGEILEKVYLTNGRLAFLIVSPK